MHYTATTDFEFNELKASKGDRLVLDEVLSARLLRAGYIKQAPAEVKTPPPPVPEPMPKPAVKKKK